MLPRGIHVTYGPNLDSFKHMYGVLLRITPGWQAETKMKILFVIGKYLNTGDFFARQ